MPGNCRFNDIWLEHRDYKQWIEKVPGNLRVARCEVCRSEFSLSNMGEAAVKSHQGGETHKKRMNQAGMLFLI